MGVSQEASVALSGLGRRALSPAAVMPVAPCSLLPRERRETQAMGPGLRKFSWQSLLSVRDVCKTF